MTKLEELLRERQRRRSAERRRQPKKTPAEMLPAAPVVEPPTKDVQDHKAPAAPPGPLEVWKTKRAAAAKRDLMAGELANMIEGLTPDGFDKEGIKVSFVETGRPYHGRGLRRLSEPVSKRFSERPGAGDDSPG